MRMTVDGVEQSEKIIPLVDDGKEHKVEVWGFFNVLAVPDMSSLTPYKS